MHALALDEKREDFAPTLWVQDPAARQKGQILKQVWFPGVHSNVGGGYEEHGLSDVALAWMASEVSDILAIDVGYLKSKRDLRNAWGMGKMYDSAGPQWKLLGVKSRTPLQPQNQGKTFETIHPSAAERAKAGAECIPKPYDSMALNRPDLANLLTELGPLERDMQWTAAEVRQPPPAPQLQSSFLDRMLRAVGAG